MRGVVAIAALVAATNALVARETDCCFDLTVGDGGGTVGQIPDGQVRFGGNLPPSRFCITSNGTISDQNGRGCILTRKLTIDLLTPDTSNPYSTNNPASM